MEHDSEDYIFPEDTAPLERISYISLPKEMEREVGGFTLSADIPLPVEPPAGQDELQVENLSWEMIISAMLKIFAYRPDHQHADYYRSFIHAVQPNLVPEMTQTGIVKAKQKDFQVAEEIFRSLVNLAPEYESSYVNLALVLEQLGEHHSQHYREDEAQSYYERAFTVYSKALERHPDSADVRYNAGHFFLKQGNLHRAKEELNTYLRLSESDEQRSEVEQLLQRMESQGEEDRTFAEAYDYIRMGEEDKGIGRVREYLEAHPDVWNGWFLLGWGLRKKEQWQEAKEAFQRSLELEPANVDTLNELSICTMELGEYPESKKHLEKALEIEPENTKIISNLAVLALKQGDTELAARFFRTVRELDPEDPVAQRFLDQLEAST
jgi:tetratricopeptide (TPR) repeat protein